MGLHHGFVFGQEVIPHKAGGTQALVEQIGLGASLGIQAVADVSMWHYNIIINHCICILMLFLSSNVYKSLSFQAGTEFLDFVLTDTKCEGVEIIIKFPVVKGDIHIL